jgi:amino acid adenylation domain-containing protein
MPTVKPLEVPPPSVGSSQEAEREALAPPRHVVPRSELPADFKLSWSDRSIPDCFALRSPRFLDAVALVTDAGDMSFRALTRLADQVAHAVHARVGERPEPVALMLEHEAPVPAVVLGVLKAGSFVVPIDPTYPADRNRFVLEDSTARLVITNRRHANAVSSVGIPSSQILDLDELALSDEREFVGPQLAPDDMTSLLYTSGSTGRPKGVIRTHRSLLRTVLQHTSTQRTGRDDRVGLLFSYSSGASMGNVFTAMLNGAALVPFNVSTNSVTGLAEWLRDRQITSFHTVPTIFRHLTDALTAELRFPRLRFIHLGGERMFASDLARFHRHFEAATKLIVGMGTSEAGHLFNFVADEHTEAGCDALPVGYPVEDSDIFLVDAERRRIGPGHVGEIAVRGAFVSPGYWRQPALSVGRIVPDTDGSTVRTFFTGDLGYMLPDGCMFFAGRIDERVKIRGQAVEMAEIEAALLSVPGVTQAAVVPVGEPPRLAAFVSARSGVRLKNADLRTAARQRLPKAMVPSTFVVLDALPMLPNGKIDRPALVRDASTRPMQASYVAPRDATEQLLASLYADALGLDEVGIDDNFFEIGGHSLPAMQVLAKIEAELGHRLAPDVLLDKPTVRELAGALTQTRRLPSDCPSLVGLQTKGAKPPFFWVHGEKSNAFLPRLLGPDQPLYGLVQQGIDGRPAFHRTLPAIAAYYRRAIQTVQPAGPYYLGGFCNGGIVAFEIAQQLRKDDHEVRLLALLDPPHRVFPGTERVRWGLWRFVSGPWSDRLVLRMRQRLALWREGAERIAHAIQGIEHTIPYKGRTLYINAIYSRARRGYVPTPYDGRVVILKTGDGRYDPERIWSSLASGVEVRQLPGPHEDIVFVEPRIDALGATLKACLTEAQQADLAQSSRDQER